MEAQLSKSKKSSSNHKSTSSKVVDQRKSKKQKSETVISSSNPNKSTPVESIDKGAGDAAEGDKTLTVHAHVESTVVATGTGAGMLPVKSS